MILILKYFIKKYMKQGNLYKSLKLLIYILFCLKKIGKKPSIYIFSNAIKNLLLPFSFTQITINSIKYKIPIIISYEQSIFNVYKLLDKLLIKKNQLMYKCIYKYLILSYNKEGELYKFKLQLIKQFISNRAYLYLLNKIK